MRPRKHPYHYPYHEFCWRFAVLAIPLRRREHEEHSSYESLAEYASD
jgi:hypothetical protein